MNSPNALFQKIYRPRPTLYITLILHLNSYNISTKHCQNEEQKNTQIRVQGYSYLWLIQNFKAQFEKLTIFHKIQFWIYIGLSCQKGYECQKIFIVLVNNRIKIIIFATIAWISSLYNLTFSPCPSPKKICTALDTVFLQYSTKKYRKWPY